MLILHPIFPVLPPIFAKITRNHTGFFRFTECGMPDLRRKTEGTPFQDCSQNHTKCDRNVRESKGRMISISYLCILYCCHACSGMKEVPGMNHEIRHYDTPLLGFSATEDILYTMKRCFTGRVRAPHRRRAKPDSVISIIGNLATMLCCLSANTKTAEGSKPMNIIWKLHTPIPAKYLRKTNQLTVG